LQKKLSYSSELQLADDLQFDIFAFSDVVGRENALGLLTTHCVNSLDLFQSLDVDKQVFEKFM
jgi:hypothetical protein